LHFEFKGLTPGVMAKRLLSLHAKVAGGESTDGMLETLAGGGQTDNVFPIWIAGTVDNYHGWTNDLLIVVEEEGDTG
jgi:hypothetical protein